MYNDFYGFRESPFNITPDPRFLFFSDKHREAFNHVLFGIRERKGFIQITGEVGAGKTTVCRAILAELGPSYKTALILNPMLTSTQLMRTVLTELGLKPRKLDRTAYLDILNHFLLEQAAAGNDVVLLIDEAQDLEPELLEQVRLLSNLETDQRKLLQIVLIGQPELREKLNQKGLRQLRQRITVRYHLRPLDRLETDRYVAHRLRVAGADGRPTFTPWAIRRVHHYSARRAAPGQRGVRQGAPVRIRQRHVPADGPRGAPGGARAGGGGRLSLIDDALKRAQEAGADGEARAPRAALDPDADAGSGPRAGPGCSGGSWRRLSRGRRGWRGVLRSCVGRPSKHPRRRRRSPLRRRLPHRARRWRRRFRSSSFLRRRARTGGRCPASATPQPAAPRRRAAEAPRSSETAPPPPPPRLGSARSYAGSVALPGGAKIELGGIAWSETEPRALLNDRIVGVGAFVEGYTVSKIETDRVELQKDGATIVVTVK